MLSQGRLPTIKQKVSGSGLGLEELVLAATPAIHRFQPCMVMQQLLWQLNLHRNGRLCEYAHITRFVLHADPA